MCVYWICLGMKPKHTLTYHNKEDSCSYAISNPCIIILFIYLLVDLELKVIRYEMLNLCPDFIFSKQ